SAARFARDEEWVSRLSNDTAAARALILAEPLSLDVYRIEAPDRVLPINRNGAAVLIAMLASDEWLEMRTFEALTRSVRRHAKAPSRLPAVESRFQDAARQMVEALSGVHGDVFV